MRELSSPWPWRRRRAGGSAFGVLPVGASPSGSNVTATVSSNDVIWRRGKDVAHCQACLPRVWLAQTGSYCPFWAGRDRRGECDEHTRDHEDREPPAVPLTM